MKNVTVLLLALLSRQLSAQDDVIQVQSDAWIAEISGGMKMREPPRGADRLSLAGDLGIQDRICSYAAQIRWVHGAGRFDLRYQESVFTGSKVFSAPKIHKGDIFPTGEENETEISIREVTFGYGRTLSTQGPFQVALGVSGRFLIFDVGIQGPSNPDNDETIGMLIPEISLNVQGELTPRLYADFYFAGSFFKGFDDTARTLTVAWSLLWTPSDWLSVHLGYRMEYLNVSQLQPETRENHDLEFFLSGPFLSLVAHF